jgi:transposase InsO family protein
MSRENPLWGTERIRGELLKLGVAVSNRSIRRYRWRGPGRRPSQTWRTFLHNHAPTIWAADLFLVQTLTFKTLYVLLFITHGRRELMHLNVTTHPTVAWVWRQVVEATAWGKRPKHLIRDRDAVYGRDFQTRAEALGIDTVLTPVRSPRANAIAERVIGTLRRDCLDHVIPLDERHLRTVLAEYVDYYNTERPHRTWASRRPGPPPAPRPVRCSRGRCSGACTTRMRGPRDGDGGSAVSQGSPV